MAIVLGNRSIRQIKASEGRETGRSLALAGVIWGWAAIGVTVLILLIILAVNGARVSHDDVIQQVAGLAFAERAYYEEHGEFTSDLDKLYFARNEKLTIGVYTDPSGQAFCVEAYGGDYERVLRDGSWRDKWQYRVATWDHEFTPDGEFVHTWNTSCDKTWQRPSFIEPDSA